MELKTRCWTSVNQNYVIHYRQFSQDSSYEPITPINSKLRFYTDEKQSHESKSFLNIFTRNTDGYKLVLFHTECLRFGVDFTFLSSYITTVLFSTCKQQRFVFYS